MFSNHSAEVSLHAPCRAVAAVAADRKESRFLVASCNGYGGGGGSSTVAAFHHPNDEDDTTANYLHVIRFHPEMNELGIDAKIPHNSCRALACCPTDPTRLVTVTQGDGTNQTVVALYKIPDTIMNMCDSLQYDPDEADALDVASSASMEQIQLLQHRHHMSSSSSSSSSPCVDVTWSNAVATNDNTEDANGSNHHDRLVTVQRDGSVLRWDTTTGQVLHAALSSATQQQQQQQQQQHSVTGWFPRVQWDPHHHSQAAATMGRQVRLIDWRMTETSSTTLSFLAHRYGVCSIDYNPHKSHTLATAGQDGVMHFWDLRQHRRPLLTARGGHSHWVSHVQYNPFHDQLVLSSGTDAVVNLWRLSTISSAPLLTHEEEEVAMGEFTHINHHHTDVDHDMDHLVHRQDKNPDTHHEKENVGATIIPRNGGPVTLSAASTPTGNGSAASANACVDRHEYGDSVYACAWASADPWIYLAVTLDGKVVLNHVPSKEKYKILL